METGGSTSTTLSDRRQGAGDIKFISDFESYIFYLTEVQTAVTPNSALSAQWWLLQIINFWSWRFLIHLPFLPQ